MKHLGMDTALLDGLSKEAFEHPQIRVLEPDDFGQLTFQRQEACGVLLGSPGSGCLMLQLPNVSRHKEHNFEIAPEMLAELHRLGIRFDGIWHTHPPRGRAVSEDDDDEASAGKNPSAIDLDYHPVHKKMFIGHLGWLRQFSLRGELVGEWVSNATALAEG